MDITVTTPIQLYRYLDEQFSGEEWLSWEMETIFQSLSLLKASAIVKDKVGAVIGCASNSKLVTTDNRAFEKVVLAFCNNPCVMDAVQPPQVEEVYWAVNQIIDIICAVHEGMIATDVTFTGEIPGYVAGVAKYHGWLVLPTRLSFASEMLDNINNNRALEKANINKYYLLRKAHAFADSIEKAKPDTKGIDSLTENTLSNSIIKKLVGCTLYKPY